MRGRRAIAMFVAVDFLAALALMQAAIIARSTIEKHPPSVTTYGQYAVTMDGHTADDIDLYVRDPADRVAWFGGLQTGPMSLTHDTIPGVTDAASFGEHERVEVRESIAGEYVANVHDYQQVDAKPATVTVRLWDLRGNDRVLVTRTVTLHGQGDEQTVFRFTLNRDGEYAGTNRLPISLLREASTGSGG